MNRLIAVFPLLFAGLAGAADQVILKNDTAANWASNNPTLANGQFSRTTDTGVIKWGTGSTTYNALPDYISEFSASFLNDADEATFKATVNLEPGTDFYSVSAVDGIVADILDGTSAFTDFNGAVIDSDNLVATVVTGLTAVGTFESGDTFICNEAGVGLRECDYDDLPSGGSGAPTDADYLLGTANGSLPGAIVVGTSPGGELGGTWASPTIDDSLSVTGWTLTTPTITGPTFTFATSAAPAQTTDGQCSWDSDDDRMACGDGAATLTFSDDSKFAQIASVDGDIIPDADGTRDLGSAANRWAEVHTDLLEGVGTLTAVGDLDIGAFEFRAQTFESDVTTGTAPFTIASTTVNINLNADLLDGESASEIVTASRVGGVSANLDDTDASIEWEDATALDTGGQLTTGAAVADTAFTDLTAGDSYTNYGTATDDTIDELFAAIDTAIGGLGGGHDAVTLDASATNILSLSTQQVNAVDAGAADALVGWDDTAGALDYLSPADVIAALGIDSDIGTLTLSASSTVSGSNTGDQTITLTGPVTGSGTGSFATTITADSVGTAQLDDDTDTPASGEWVQVDAVDQAGFTYRSDAEAISDLGIDADITTLTLAASSTVSGSNTGDQNLADTVAEITDLDDDAATLTIAASSSISGSNTGDQCPNVTANTKAAAYTVGTDDSCETDGGFITVTSAATITLPAVSVGDSVTVQTIGAVAVSVDPNAADRMYLDGTALDDGDQATNTSTTGDLLYCVGESAAGWTCISGSPDGDHWTDGG